MTSAIRTSGGDGVGRLVAPARDRDVDVGVYDARHHEHAGRVDLPGAGWHGDTAVRSNSLDTAVINKDGSWRDGAVGDGQERGVTDRCCVGFWPQGAGRSPPLPELTQIALVFVFVLTVGVVVVVVLRAARVSLFRGGAFGFVQATVHPGGGDGAVICE